MQVGDPDHRAGPAAEPRDRTPEVGETPTNEVGARADADGGRGDRDDQVAAPGVLKPRQRLATIGCVVHWMPSGATRPVPTAVWWGLGGLSTARRPEVSAGASGRLRLRIA